MERKSREGSSEEDCRLEEARIREAYAKRQVVYSWFSPGHLFRVQEKERRLLRLLKHHGLELLSTKEILEIGCGTGHWLREFIKWGARPEHVTGVDLLADRVTEARRLCPKSVKVHCGSAAKLEFPDSTFDLVFQSTLFTSILESGLKQQIASEMLRVTKPDGLIIWYDFFVNNPWNPDVRGVKKREIRQLFPGCQARLHRITLAPPLLRSLAPYSWLVCHLLGKIPWLCTHYLGAICKGSAFGGVLPATEHPAERQR